jgi:antitoxin VapB
VVSWLVAGFRTGCGRRHFLLAAPFGCMYIPVGYTGDQAIAKLFRSNRSQALRLPKEAEFPPNVTDVEVVVHGNVRILVPKAMTMSEWLQSGPRLSDDFSVEPRDLGPQEERDFPWE